MKRYENMSDTEFKEYLLKNMLRITEDLNAIINNRKPLRSSYIMSKNYGNLERELKELLEDSNNPLYANEWN